MTASLFERIKRKELEEKLTTLNIMSTVFEMQMILAELELPDLAKKLSELVDNINRASLNPIWDVCEYDARKKKMQVKIDVPMDAYMVLRIMHEVLPKHKILALYVEFLNMTAFKGHPIVKEMDKCIVERADSIKSVMLDLAPKDKKVSKYIN